MKQKHVPLVAIFNLSGGMIKPNHVEDIAIKSKEISPSSFSWKKYSEHIDLRQVMRTMRALRNEELVDGSNSTAWSLTNKGLYFVEQSGLLDMDSTQVLKKRSELLTKEYARIENSDAFVNWNTNLGVTSTQAKKLLRIDDYSSQNQIRNNIARFEQVTNELSKINKKFEGFSKIIIEQIRHKEEEQ